MKIGVITPVKADSNQKVKWLIEAIQSVRAQTHEDWEMVIVNDRSSVKFGDFPELLKEMGDDRVKGVRASAHGVSGVAGARNLAVEQCNADYLLPLDADDLLPPDAMETYVKAWGEKPGGVLYGHTELRQNNSSRTHQARPYSFQLLLNALMMPVGSFHSRKAWAEVGGWTSDMDGGLEDWEYWIKLGEVGVCGNALNKVLYIYRRHPHSRLSWLRTSGEYGEALAKMRERHEDVYNGRYPVRCCGGGQSKRRTPPANPNVDVVQRELQGVVAESEAVADGNLVAVVYEGALGGSWGVNGHVTGTHYTVPGPGKVLTMPDGRQGVMQEDVVYILALERGRAFRRA